MYLFELILAVYQTCVTQRSTESWVTTALSTVTHSVARADCLQNNTINE